MTSINTLILILSLKFIYNFIFLFHLLLNTIILISRVDDRGVLFLEEKESNHI